jgi:hypothetical protein
MLPAVVLPGDGTVDQTVPLLFQGGEPVILDLDLARLFGVETGRLNEAVKRQGARFEGYLREIPVAEVAALISQDATSKGRGGRTKPYKAYTEHGVVMAATVLNSDEAIRASRRIVEAFVAERRKAPARAADAGMLARLRGQFERLMQAEIDKVTGTTVQDEAAAFLRDGIGALRARLQRAELANEETEARILKTLAEAEEARARAATEREMTAKQRQKNLANAMRLLLEAELALAGGEIAAFRAVLADLGGD